MLAQTVVDAIEGFLMQVPKMTMGDLRAVGDAAANARDIRRPLRPVLRLSAADLSWLEKRVRDVLRPMFAGWASPPLGLVSGSVDVVTMMAQAIARQDRLTPQQYDSFAYGFRGVGVHVPPHPLEGAGGAGLGSAVSARRTLPEAAVDEIEALLEQLPQLTLTDFRSISSAEIEALDVRKSAWPLLRLPPADISWLDTRVRDVVVPLMESWGREGVGMAGTGCHSVMETAKAIVCRARLSREQYDATVGGFRRVGVRVPPYLSEVDG